MNGAEKGLRVWLRSQAPVGRSAAQCGILLAKWFLYDAVALPESGKMRCEMTAPFGRCGRDVLPLPFDQTALSSVPEINRLTELPVPRKAVHVPRVRKTFLLGKQAWSVCQTLSLNMAWGKEVVSVRPASASQGQALANMENQSGRLIAAVDENGKAIRCTTTDWGSKLKTLGISYSGEVVEKAHFLTLEQVLPGLPPAGRSAAPWEKRHR